MEDTFGDYTFFIEEKQSKPAGQLYLGTFLAVVIFLSFFFGSIIFFVIVVIICILIFLEKEQNLKDEYGRIRVNFTKDYFDYGPKRFYYSDCFDFYIHDEVFGDKEANLKITFKKGARADLFVQLPEYVQIDRIYDIIRRSVKLSDKKELSFTEQLVLRFF